MEWCVVGTVAVDFTFVQIIVDFFRVAGWDVVCGAPDFAEGGCFGFEVGKLCGIR